MKVLYQNFKSGALDIIECPTPTIGSHQLLVRSHQSLISAGTEKMLRDFGEANLIQKAIQQPAKVKQTIDKIRTDGVLETLEAVNAKLDDGVPLGYCNVGTVVAVGSQITDIKVGDRVASNASHSDLAVVSKHLCAKVPSNVSDDDAVFTVIASIALHSVRLLNPQIAENIVVFGVGLVGQLAVQILLANGCRVFAVDSNPKRLEQVKQLGATVCALSSDVVANIMHWTDGRGSDATLIAASTKSSSPIQQAAEASRKRGRIVLVGAVGMTLEREHFYHKELTFQISCSYGPGRYDNSYELAGQDYPIGYVRWTEQRNFDAVLALMSRGNLTPSRYIERRFAFDKANEAYQLLNEPNTPIGIVLQYDQTAAASKQGHQLPLGSLTKTELASIVVEVIGAGNYSKRQLLPALKASKSATLFNICSRQGINAAKIGRQFGFQSSSSCALFAESNNPINAVVIASRHDSHADYVVDALKANKHVFVEKPLAITNKQLKSIVATLATSQTILTVGFNRRFAPLVQKMMQLLQPLNAPKSMVVTVNAGSLPADDWQLNKTIGGGRIIGEACHFVDLLLYICGHTIVDSHIVQLAKQQDTVTINLTFADGSIGTIHYFANGNRSFPKERVEIFCQGKVLQLDNFRLLKGCGFKGFNQQKLWRQDKGHKQCLQHFFDCCQNGQQPIPIDDLIAVSQLCIDLA